MTANYVIESIKNGRDLSSEHLIREMLKQHVVVFVK